MSPVLPRPGSIRVRLRQFALLALIAVTGLHAAEPVIAPPTTLPSPAGPGALTPQLTTAPDGIVYMSWLELVSEEHRLRVSRFDAVSRTWTPAQTVAQGPDWFVNWADTPQIAAGSDGRLVVAWFVKNPALAHNHDHHGTSYGARVSFSEDRGLTWSAPTPISRESNLNEFVALQALSDGRWLATWLDGRARDTASAMQLWGRILQSDAPDQLIDDRVCDCCSTSLVAFPDGSALVAYRDRSASEVRDIAKARFNGTSWEPPSLIHADGWEIAACPVNGPMLSVQGATVAIAWFTAANDQPRVLASSSSEAGNRFFVPNTLNDAERPLGRVDSALLRDGSHWVSWLENSGAVRIRRISPSGSAGIGLSIAGGIGEASRAGGFPRIALLKDYDESPAQLILARTVPGEPSQIVTQLITLPAALDLAEEDCGCDPTTTNVQSYPVRGRIITPMPERGTLLVRHSEVPGVMRAMTMEFNVSPATLAAAREGRDIFARIERRADGRWWLTDMRMIMRPGEAP